MTGPNGRPERVFLIGGSAGSIEATRDLLSLLPSKFQAPILIVIHTAPESPGLLANVLQRSSKMLVQTAQDRVRLRSGVAHVGPPNLHLLVEDSVTRLMPGPVENRHRPAIDPLFRSASRAYGARAVGIILSGYLDDGCGGLYRIKQSGGVTIVQDPDDAIVPDMPRNAMELVDPDYVLPVAKIAELMQRLASEAVAAEQDIGGEAMTENSDNPPSKLATYTCPECHGNLWEVEEGRILKFRCRVGHSFTADTMLADQSLDVERALWAALRVLEENGELSTRLAARARKDGHTYAHRRYADKAEEAGRNATALRELLVHGRQEPRPERSLDEAKADAKAQESKSA